jgi:hypothetical protein
MRAMGCEKIFRRRAETLLSTPPLGNDLLAQEPFGLDLT